MCPNCVTPWKCNGPHLSDETVAARRAGPPVAPDLDALEAALRALDEEAKSARRLSHTSRWPGEQYAAGIELSIRRVRAALDERETPE